MSDATQKNAFTDESPSASEDDDDNDDDDDETVNEGSKHIVLGDREAEERIQRARRGVGEKGSAVRGLLEASWTLRRLVLSALGEAVAEANAPQIGVDSCNCL